MRFCFNVSAEAAVFPAPFESFAISRSSASTATRHRSVSDSYLAVGDSRSYGERLQKAR